MNNNILPELGKPYLKHLESQQHASSGDSVITDFIDPVSMRLSFAVSGLWKWNKEVVAETEASSPD